MGGAGAAAVNVTTSAGVSVGDTACATGGDSASASASAAATATATATAPHAALTLSPAPPSTSPPAGLPKGYITTAQLQQLLGGEVPALSVHSAGVAVFKGADSSVGYSEALLRLLGGAGRGAAGGAQGAEDATADLLSAQQQSQAHAQQQQQQRSMAVRGMLIRVPQGPPSQVELQTPMG